MIEVGRPGWIALGLDLELLAESGRLTPVSLVEPLGYRPNWGLPSMTGVEQTCAPVLCGSPSDFPPGARGRVVIVPPYPWLLDEWHTVGVGDVLKAFEGPRLIGTGRVCWVRSTVSPDRLRREPLQSDLVRWAEGGPEPRLTVVAP